ncbi:D-alanyl-D-alanine carboxypeptidase [Candidatus Peregrinibacteria bacterium]|jgi:serine-type D-Ala-D-Ala carboxypeptidase (penicillin-binding protein 5/6)|nr:D-alanyl-D-alanine carboxypeptidase [Candidatus Peregrinibacteria bacterium]MBT4055867.1 D-alanyl-D-alanine carboxypeptidase [Candidatus Peregrinibacteria bacterium]
MLTSLIGFYIASTLQPILPINLEDNIQSLQIIEQASLNIHKLDFHNLLSASPIPIKKDTFVSPVIEAKSSVAIDNQTGEVLFEKNGNARRQIASITKLMTATIILEENNLQDIVTISNTASNTNGSQMFLRVNEQITVEDLLYGVLINSANDAAEALAEHNAGSIKKFVEKMNNKASELGLLNTRFQNPIGFDHRYNYSSAIDVAKLARYAYQKSFVQEAATIQELEVMSVDKQYTHDLETTNELLGSYLNIKGLKTGKTELAGLCHVSVAENDEGNDIITVVLGSPDRFRESKVLIDWIFRAYIW